MRVDKTMVVVGTTRFGDEHSTLLDEYERLSFEAHAAQLNRVMLGRTLSEPKSHKPHSGLIMHGPTPPHGGFRRVLNKFLKPFLGVGRKRGKQDLDHKDSMSFKTFSRSLRF